MVCRQSLFLPLKYPYFLFKSEHYTRLPSLMDKNQQLVLTNQRVFVGNCLKIKKNHLNHAAIISSEQKFFLIKEEKDFPNLPEMLKIRWKWWQEWLANCNCSWTGLQCEENSPSASWSIQTQSHGWSFALARDSQLTREPRAHSKLHQPRQESWYPLSSSVEESGNLLGFALRSDLLNFLHQKKIEVNVSIESSSCRVEMKEEERLLMLF